MTTKTLTDGLGATFSADLNLALGRLAAASSKSVVLSTEDLAALSSLDTRLVSVIAALTTIAGYVDGLEGYTDTLEALHTTLNTLVTLTNSYVDGLETLVTSSNTKLDSLIAQGAATTAVPIAMADEYETVAASASNQNLGATGATGDRLAGVLVQPTSTTRGAVTIKDGSNTVYTLPAATVAADLPPTFIPFGIKSVSGAWNISTGSGVGAVGIGDFS